MLKNWVKKHYNHVNQQNFYENYKHILIFSLVYPTHTVCNSSIKYIQKKNIGVYRHSPIKIKFFKATKS